MADRFSLNPKCKLSSHCPLWNRSKGIDDLSKQLSQLSMIDNLQVWSVEKALLPPRYHRCQKYCSWTLIDFIDFIMMHTFWLLATSVLFSCFFHKKVLEVEFLIVACGRTFFASVCVCSLINVSTLFCHALRLVKYSTNPYSAKVEKTKSMQPNTHKSIAFM